MAVGDLWLAGNSPNGIYRSTDGGATWGSLIAAPSGQINVQGVAIDPRNGDLWLAGASPNGIYRSTDGGATWGSLISPPSGQTGVLGVAIDPRNGDLWLAGTVPDGIYRSTDGGATWGSLISPPSGQTDVHDVAIDPRNGDLWLAGNSPDGIYRSTDGGATWGSLITAPSGQTGVQGVAIDPRNDDLWLAGNSPDGIYRSTDGGATWGSLISPPSGQTGVFDIHVELGTIPIFADDTGDAITGTIGEAIADVTVPEATGIPAPTHAVEGTLPTGVTFNTDTPPDDAAGVLEFDETAIVPGTGTITIRATNSVGTADWTVDYTFEEASASVDLGSHSFGALTASLEATTAGGLVSADLGSHSFGALTASLETTTVSKALDLDLFQATGTVHMLVCLIVGRYERGNGQENLWASDQWTNDGAAGQVGAIAAGSWDITGIAGNAPVMRRLARWDNGDRLIFNTTGTGAIDDLFDASSDPYRISLVRLVSGVPSLITIEPPSTGGNNTFIDWREDSGDMTAAEWSFIDALAAGDELIVALHQGTASYQEHVPVDLGSHALGSFTATLEAHNAGPVSAELGSHALGALTASLEATPNEDPVAADLGSHDLGALTASAEATVADATAVFADLGSRAFGALTASAEATPHVFGTPVSVDLGTHAFGALTASLEAVGADDPLGAITVTIGAPFEAANDDLWWFNVSVKLGDAGARAIFADQTVAYWLRDLRIDGASTGDNFTRMRLARSSTESATTAGPDFTESWEQRSGDAIRIDAGGLSLEIGGPNSTGVTDPDDTDPYAWQPNSADLTAITNFVAAFVNLTDTEKAATTLTFPGAEPVSADLGTHALGALTASLEATVRDLEPITIELGNRALGALTATAEATPASDPVSANLGTRAFGSLTATARVTITEDPVSTDLGTHALGALTASLEASISVGTPHAIELGSYALGALTAALEAEAVDQTSAVVDLGTHALGALTASLEVTSTSDPVSMGLGSHALGSLAATLTVTGAKDPIIVDLGSPALGALTATLEASVTTATAISAALGSHSFGSLTAMLEATALNFAAIWPSSLPSEFLQRGFRLVPIENVRRFVPERGPAIRQRRFTKADTLYRGRIRMTASEWDALEEFYEDTLLAGSSPVEFPKPLGTGTVRVEFTERPRRSYRDGDWIVEMSLRRIA